MHGFKRSLISVCLVLALFFTLVGQAQPIRLSAGDKTQIVKSILTQENFKDSETWRSDQTENTIYLLSENISPTQIPQIKGIKFVLITEKDVEVMKQSGVEYYRFDELRVRKSSVRTSLTREYMNVAEKHANGSTMNYIGRKVSGKWIIKGRLDGVYTAESK